MSNKIRHVLVQGDKAFVTLTKGFVAIIDAADLPLVNQWNWTAMVHKRVTGEVRAVYAYRRVKTNGQQQIVLMHRAIAQPLQNQNVDHRDGDGLNNCRSNLRFATVSENARNKKIDRRNTSGRKGVYFDKQRRLWAATIRHHGKQVFLGRYAEIEEAAAAYETASQKFHGEYGRVS